MSKTTNFGGMVPKALILALIFTTSCFVSCKNQGSTSEHFSGDSLTSSTNFSEPSHPDEEIHGDANGLMQKKSIEVCNVGGNKLSEISNSLESISLALENEVNKTNGSTCSVVMTYVENMATSIKSQTELLGQIKMLDKNLFKMLKEKHVERLVQFNLVIEIFKYVLIRKGSLHNSTLTDFIDNARDRINLMNANTTDITTIRSQSMVKFLVFMIRDEKTVYAVNKFNFWGKAGSKEIVKIVDLLYDGYLENFYFVLYFVTNVDDCIDRKIGFLALFKNMNENGHLKSAKLLTLIKTALLTCAAFMQDFVADLKIYETEIIEEWVSQILDGNFRPCYMYFRYFEHWEAKLMGVHTYIHKIVDGAYNNTRENFPKVLAFVGSLEEPFYCYEGYYTMFEIMSNNDDLGNNANTQLLIAVVRKVISRVESKDLKNKYDDPPEVHDIFYK